MAELSKPAEDLSLEQIRVEYQIFNDLNIIIDGGYLIATDGNFDTSYVGFNLAYLMQTFAQDQKGAPLKETDLSRLVNGVFVQRTNGILMPNVRTDLPAICSFWEENRLVCGGLVVSYRASIKRI